jgi:hypothetical protein
MSKTKKLDIFNLFYSGAAVVILIGVIAKLLEWPAQDILITGGLAIEAVVFGVSAIKFVEVKTEKEGATEATLSKVAEGLGNISAGSVNGGGTGSGVVASGSGTFGTGSVGGRGSGDAFINIQTGNSDTPISSATNASDKNVSISINNPASHQNNASHTLWQLEQMDILSLAKDLFFQPKWDALSSEEYTQLSSLFKRVFDKKLPNKEALPFLLQFPVKLPVPELSKLLLDKPHQIESAEIELLCKAFNIINFHNYLDNFILESIDVINTIRPKKATDVQIYGGEDESVIQHVKKYFNEELIISPNIECLQENIKLKGQSLLEFFVQKIDIKKEDELSSLNTILLNESDELKLKLWNKFKKIKFNQLSNEGYLYLKLLAQSAVSFANINSGAQLFNKLVELKINENKSICLDDVVNFAAENIYFGPKNEYSVSLKELFVNGELENLGYVQSLIEKLVAENIAPKAKLVQIFNLNEQDSKKEVFDKLNYHLSKTNTSPSGTQLAFVLLYKQYVNS